MRVKRGATTDYYSPCDNISEFNKSEHRVTGVRGDWVTAYRLISFRDKVYRDFWYWDKFTGFTFM